MSDDISKPTRETSRERRTTILLLSAVIVGGGFATIALLIGVWNLLRKYGGL